MKSTKPLLALAATALLAACAQTPPAGPASAPAGWQAPEVVVAPSSFTGVHGLAVDQRGRLLAGSVVGNALWEVDRQSGAAKILVGGPDGQADDIAVGPRGELAWTNYLMGMLRYRVDDASPMRVLAKDLPGLNSLDFDRRNGKLYASQVFLGDALWEIDVAGNAPPRLIAKDMGGFNGFEVGPDGMLYGPLWFKGQAVKINPANGQITVIADGFKIPAAANLDGKGNLYVIDTATGELVRVALATGAKTVAARLSTSLDNLAIAPEGTVYVSNMADNAITAYDPASGAVRTLTSGKLAVPAGLKVAGNELFVADIFAFRRVDLGSGSPAAVHDVKRMHATTSDMEYPFAVGVSSKHIALASWFSGWVQVMDRSTRQTLANLHGFKAPYDVLPMEDGTLLVAEIATGSILRLSGDGWKTQATVASGLPGPVQMTLGADGGLYVTVAAGKLLRVNLADGKTTEVAGDLGLPEGVAQTPWGSFIVAETAAGRLVEIDPARNLRRIVADQLPIGLSASPGMPPPYVVTGVSVAADGTVYFSADRNNAVYRIRPRR